MLKISIKLMLGAVSVFTVLISSAAEIAIKNSGFESAANGIPQGWKIKAASGEKNPVTVDHSVAHQGKSSLRIRHNNGESYSRATTYVKLKPHTDYIVTFQIKTNDVKRGKGVFSGSARMLILGKGGKCIAASKTLRGTSDWHQTMLSFHSGNLSNLPIIFYLHRASGTVWFDDLNIVEGKVAMGKGVKSNSRLLEGPHLAIGKKYTMQKPNYKLSSDAGDNIQLTDGKFADSKRLWVDKATVAWMHRAKVTVIVDLEKIEPIRELALGVLGGAKGNVDFPDAGFFVSENGKDFYLVGYRFGTKMPDRGQRYAALYHLNDLTTKGRYVAVCLIPNGSFICIDEIEVIKGGFSPDSVTLSGATYNTATMKSAITADRKQAIKNTMLKFELKPLEENIKTKKPEWQNKVTALIKKIDAGNLTHETRKKIKVAAGIINAELFKSLNPKDKQSIIAYQGGKWHDFHLFDQPCKPKTKSITLDFVMGANEYEYNSFKVFNNSCKTCPYKVSVSELKDSNGTIAPVTIKVRYGEWVECSDSIMRPDALPLLDGEVSLIPGGNCEFWISLKTNKTPAGDYYGTVSVDNGIEKEEIKMSVKVYPVTLAAPLPLATYNWSYSIFAPVKADLPAAIADLKMHYINIMTVHPSNLPRFSFDKKGRLVKSSYTKLDKLIKTCKINGFSKFRFFCNLADIRGVNLKRPFGSLAVKTSGIKFGSPTWKNAMHNMVRDWVSHLKKIGIGYDQFTFYPFDEPRDKLLKYGAKEIMQAFKEADPNVKIFTNPINNKIELLQGIAPYVDIWSPRYNAYKQTNQIEQKYLNFCKNTGKKLFLYNCQGPDKLFHSLGHYRKMSWYAWKNGITGIGFWCYADTGNSVKNGQSAWTDFDGSRTDYSIIYDKATAPKHVTRKESIIPSRRWKAWRDGIEDYSYLFALNREINLSKQKRTNKKIVRDAEILMKSSISDVMTNSSDIDVYTNVKARILETIVKLRK